MIELCLSKLVDFLHLSCSPVANIATDLLSQSTSLVSAIFKLLFEEVSANREEQQKETFKLQKKVKELTNENMKMQVQLKNRKMFNPPKQYIQNLC